MGDKVKRPVGKRDWGMTKNAGYLPRNKKTGAKRKRACGGKIEK